MELVSQKDLKRIEEWSSVTGRKLLFYHNDPDGICSAALWMKSFRDFEPLAREGPIMEQGFVRWVADQDPDVLVFMDMPVDQEWKKMKWLEKHLPDLKIIVIDHHIPEKDMNSSRTIHVNNKLVSGLDKNYLPAAYIVYNILEYMGRDVKQMKWIAGTGIIGDYGQRDCAGFFMGMKSKMGKMGTASEMISAAVTFKGRKGADRSLKILLREKGLDGFLQRETLGIWKGFVDAELKKVMQEFRKKKEELPGMNLVMFRIESRLNIVSTISTALSEKYPEKIIVIYKQNPRGMWKASLRLQNGSIDLGTLTKKAVKGIGSGGGHRQAAGARFSDWARFRKRLTEELGKTYLGRSTKSM